MVTATTLSRLKTRSTRRTKSTATTKQSDSFVDGTIISICYVKGGVWKITHEAIGKAWYELTRCEDDDDDAYSDVFKIDSEIISYEAFTPKANPYKTYKSKIKKS